MIRHQGSTWVHNLQIVHISSPELSKLLHFLQFWSIWCPDEKSYPMLKSPRAVSCLYQTENIKLLWEHAFIEPSRASICSAESTLRNCFQPILLRNPIHKDFVFSCFLCFALRSVTLVLIVPFGVFPPAWLINRSEENWNHLALPETVPAIWNGFPSIQREGFDNRFIAFPSHGNIPGT